MQVLLKSRISQERNEIKRLMEMLTECGTEKKKPKERIHSPNEAEMTAMIQLVKENQLLEVCSFKRWMGEEEGKGISRSIPVIIRFPFGFQKKMTTLIRSIIEEKEACVELRVQLAVHQLMAKT